MGRHNTGNKVGRPTTITPDVVQKLDSIFKVGGTVDEAVTYAGIGRSTYFDHLAKNDDFRTKMESAQHYADIVAKNVVIDSIVKDRDLGTAKWWLEKRQFRNESQTNIQVNIPTFNVMSSEAKEQLEKLYEGSDSTNN